jgi:PIN domain nuclease of toxin-antitoxin system
VTTLLLDTHVFLRWRMDSSALPANVRTAVSRADVVMVSTASGWEVAIKIGLGKLRLDDPFGWMVEESGFTPLPVTFAHTERLAALPLHHRDPFDRMLIAQAQSEHATIVTHDPQFKRYDVPILWT